MALVLVAALFAAIAIASDHVGGILGAAATAVLLLYEPLLVSLTGSTVGHNRTNPDPHSNECQADRLVRDGSSARVARLPARRCDRGAGKA